MASLTPLNTGLADYPATARPVYEVNTRDKVGVRIINVLCRVLLTKAYRDRLTALIVAGMLDVSRQSTQAQPFGPDVSQAEALARLRSRADR